MSRLSYSLLRISKNPLQTILVIIAVGLLVMGIFIAGPWYISSATSVVGVAIESYLGRLITGFGYIIPAVMVMWGAWGKHPTLLYRGNFLMFLAFVFMFILRLLTLGPTPIIWVLQVVLAAVTGFIFLVTWGDEQ